MIICGRGAASKLEKNEQKEKNFLNLEDLFGGLIKNCQRQFNSEKQNFKNVINCFYHWNFQLLLKIKIEHCFWSISCSIAHLSPQFYIPNWISKTIHFFDILKRGWWCRWWIDFQIFQRLWRPKFVFHFFGNKTLDNVSTILF